ncbi:MAG: hypothetical protein HRU40_14640 [Saprospiraceae bacterium]|nr:hypothetical protein [Saprospiraceae bacterium]
MEKIFRIFHYASFLQYPFLGLALFYCYKPIFKGLNYFDTDAIIDLYNTSLLFLGIALSFTSLADIRKRTKLGDHIFGNKKRARKWLIYMCSLIIIIFGFAIFCKFFTNNEKLENLSIGLFVLGIGMLGLLRMNIEIIKSYQNE